MTAHIGQCGEWDSEYVKSLLDQQQQLNLPAWFDGSCLYTLAGKMVLERDEHGRPEIRPLHPLSRSGLLRWFEPSERYSYNQAMLDAWQAQQEEEEAATNAIEEWIESLPPLRGKKGKFCAVLETKDE